MKRPRSLACRLAAAVLAAAGLAAALIIALSAASPAVLPHSAQGAGEPLPDGPAASLLAPRSSLPSGLQPPPAPAQLHVVTSTADHLVVEFAASDPVVQQLVLDGRSHTRVAVPGLESLSESGRPPVPAAWMLMALPPDTHAELRLLADDAEMLVLPQPPFLIPGVSPPLQATAEQAMGIIAQVLPPPPGEPGAPLTYGYDAEVAPADPYPVALAAVGAPIRWRSQFIAMLRVYPVQFLAAQRAVRFHRRLQIEVRFVRSTGGTTGAATDGAMGQPQTSHAPSAPDEGVLEPLVLHLLANADVARAWRLGSGSAPQAAALPVNPLSPSAATPAGGDHRWWKIRANDKGLYRIGCDQLAPLFGAGAPDLAGLRLYAGAAQEAAGDSEVALREVDANHNGHCDGGEGDGIEFWAEPSAGRYDAGAYYWLTIGPDPGVRMELRPSATGDLQPAAAWGTLLAEENHYYRSTVPRMSPGSGNHDHWFWSLLASGSNTFPATRTFPFALGSMVETGAAPPASAVVSVTLAGLDGAHRIEVSINGAWLGDLVWQGPQLYEGSLAIPPGILQPGENCLRLALPANPTGGPTDDPAAAQDRTSGSFPSLVAPSPVLVDRFSLRYRLAQPAQLDGDSSLVMGVEAGRRQFAFAAAGPVTLLEIGDPLHPVEIGPADGGSKGEQVWGIDSDKAGTYVAVAAGARLDVESIREETPSQWRSPANGADYILIAHHSLWAAAQRLADQRRRQGLRVALVDVQDVYDEFNGGQVDAAAIHAFLAYAYAYWQSPAPAYVLLLGDGTFDARGYCISPGACPQIVTPPGSTLIPPYLANVDSWLGETATDNRFAALEPGSNLPWLAIGRLPANNLAEAQAMVDKILAYEDAAPTRDEESAAYLALVSDNAYAVDGAADAAGNFWQTSDAALAQAQQVAAGSRSLRAERFYLNVCDPARFAHCALPNPPYHPYTDGPKLLAELAAWLSAPPIPRPDGASILVHYVGHGSITGWAGQPLILQSSDVAQLGATPRLPLVLDMTCYTGYFHFPGLPALAEAWLAAPQQGAVAAIASSGLGLAEAHAALDFALLTQLIGRGATTAGEALLAAKVAAAAGGLAEEVDTFHLFGDPAMPLYAIRPAPASTPLPPPPVTPNPSPSIQPATPVATPYPPAAAYLPWLAAEGER